MVVIFMIKSNVMYTLFNSQSSQGRLSHDLFVEKLTHEKVLCVYQQKVSSVQYSLLLNFPFTLTL